jgi:hypothetical protein
MSFFSESARFAGRAVAVLLHHVDEIRFGQQLRRTGLTLVHKDAGRLELLAFLELRQTVGRAVSEITCCFIL